MSSLNEGRDAIYARYSMFSMAQELADLNKDTAPLSSQGREHLRVFMNVDLFFTSSLNREGGYTVFVRGTVRCHTVTTCAFYSGYRTALFPHTRGSSFFFKIHVVAAGSVMSVNL